MIIKVSGIPSVVVDGTNYSVGVPVSTYDDDGWMGAQASLTVTGNISDTPQAFWTKLKDKASKWEKELGVKDTFQTKLAGIVGKQL